MDNHEALECFGHEDCDSSERSMKSVVLFSRGGAWIQMMISIN